MTFSCSMIEPGHPGDEVRQLLQLRLALAPVVIRRPVARQLLHRLELYALRRIADGLSLWPLRRHDALTEVVQLLFWDIQAEGTNRAVLSGRCYVSGLGLPGHFPLSLAVRAPINAPS